MQLCLPSSLHRFHTRLWYTNQGHRIGLFWECSNEFNENVLKSISRNQLGSIYPTTFGDIPVATFKNIPAEAFTALTKAQMYKMDYSDNNNQCAALSAEQFAQIPYTSLVYQSGASIGLFWECSSQLNGNANDALTLMSGDQLKSIYPISFRDIQAETFAKIKPERFAKCYKRSNYKNGRITVRYFVYRSNVKCACDCVCSLYQGLVYLKCEI